MKATARQQIAAIVQHKESKLCSYCEKRSNSWISYHESQQMELKSVDGYRKLYLGALVGQDFQSRVYTFRRSAQLISSANVHIKQVLSL